MPKIKGHVMNDCFTWCFKIIACTPRITNSSLSRWFFYSCLRSSEAVFQQCKCFLLLFMSLLFYCYLLLFIVLLLIVLFKKATMFPKPKLLLPLINFIDMHYMHCHCASYPQCYCQPYSHNPSSDSKTNRNTPVCIRHPYKYSERNETQTCTVYCT